MIPYLIILFNLYSTEKVSSKDVVTIILCVNGMFENIYDFSVYIPELITRVGVLNSNEDFLKDHFNKFYIIKNLNAINISKEDRGDKIVTEYFKNFKFDKVDKLKALLEKFGFKIEDKVITKLADVEKEVIHKEIESFLTDRKIRTLFNLKKDSTIKYHYSDLNNILESYGLEIKDKKKSVKVNKKVETKYIPNIVFTKLTSEYLDRIQQQDIKDKEAIYLNMLNDPLLEGVPINTPN